MKDQAIDFASISLDDLGPLGQLPDFVSRKIREWLLISNTSITKTGISEQF